MMRLPKPRLHVAVTINGLGTISIVTHVLEPHALACCFVEEINLSGHYKGKERGIRKVLNKKYPFLSVIERLNSVFLATLSQPGLLMVRILGGLITGEARRLFKVIPEFYIAHSYCARFLRHQRHKRARVQNIRDFPQTKLDSEMKAPFFLNELGDPHFLFYKFNENNIRNN